MATAPENPPAAPAPKPEPPEGKRYLDDAVGGDLVDIGPLGGPKPKTRERLLAEQELATEASTKAEREAIDAAKAEVQAEASAEPAPAA